MSHIDKLIEDLCPSGVTYRELGECVLRNTGGGTPSRSRHDYWDGPIPWASVGDITASKLTLAETRQTITEAGLSGSSSNLIPAGHVVVAVKIVPGAMRVVERDVAINQDLRGLLLRDEIDPYFLTYYFQTIDIVGDGTIVKGITKATLERVRIPVPHLEVQREIVRVLDQFTQLEAELAAELEAELENRRRQYEYYRDSLMTSPSGGCTRIPLGEVGKFIRGRRFTKADVVAEGIPSIHYGEIYTHYGVATLSTISHVRESLADQLRFAAPGDVVIAAVGETVEDVGKAVAWLGDEPVAIHDDTFLFRSGLNPKFVSYFLQTADFHIQKNKYVARAKVKRLSGESLAKILINVPSLSEQERIVALLDRFDAAVNDLSLRISTELASRRQQYEHYRGRLLTFQEAVA